MEQNLNVFAQAKATTAAISPQHMRITKPAASGGAFVEVAGQTMLVTPSAFNDLLKVISFNKQTKNAMDKSLSPEATVFMLNEFLKSVSKRKNVNDIIIALDDKKHISRIAHPDQKSKALPKTLILQLAEMMIGKGGMEIGKVRLDPDRTKGNIQLNYPGLQKSQLIGEEFKTGISINWDMFTGTNILDLVIREICSNGMVGIQSDFIGQLNKDSSMDEWYQTLFEKSTGDKLNKDYQRHMNRNSNQTISVREHDWIMKLIRGYNPDEELVKEHIGDDSWRGVYSAAGVDLVDVSKAKAAQMPTPINRWSAVNLMTNVFTHNGNGMRSAYDQTKAGKFFTAAGDSETWSPFMDNPFQNN